MKINNTWLKGAALEKAVSIVCGTKNAHNPRISNNITLNNSFQQLINQLFYAKNTDITKKVFIFIGATREVGVTSIMILFAKFLSNVLGLRILLIDANFSRPTLHKLLMCESKKGFCELISGDNNPEIVQKSSIKNCHVLAPGNRKLLNNTLLSLHEYDNKHLMKLASDYELILIDCEPITLAPESYRLASIADGVIMVARAEKTAKALIKASRDRLDQIEAKIVGCILNRRQFRIPPVLYKLLR